MPTFDRKKFFKGFEDRIDSTIEPKQRRGLNFLLDQMEKDPFWKHIPQIAYALATVGHETAWSFEPVEEGYYLGDAARVKRFQKTLRYYPYFGRGYVQLTWKTNYDKAGKILKLPSLVDKPDLAKDPNVAYKVMTRGMHQGWFTGKKLDDYIKGDKKDYKNARMIINGHDKDALIAGYARKFEQILDDSVVAPASIPLVEPTETEPVQTLTEPSAPQPITETKVTQTVETSEASVTQEQTITAPKGDLPGVPPRFVLPGVGAGGGRRLRNRRPPPHQLAGSRVIGAHVAGGRLLVEEVVADRAAEDHEVFVDRRRGVDLEVRRLDRPAQILAGIDRSFQPE